MFFWNKYKSMTPWILTWRKINTYGQLIIIKNMSFNSVLNVQVNFTKSTCSAERIWFYLFVFWVYKLFYWPNSMIRVPLCYLLYVDFQL